MAILHSTLSCLGDVRNRSQFSPSQLVIDKITTNLVFSAFVRRMAILARLSLEDFPMHPPRHRLLDIKSFPMPETYIRNSL